MVAINKNVAYTAKDNSSRSTVLPGQNDPLFAYVKRGSLIQRLGTEVVTTKGGAYVVSAGRAASAAFVNEGDSIKVQNHQLEGKLLAPEKVAAIFLTTREVAELPSAQFMEAIMPQAGEAIARAFDAAILYGTVFGKSLNTTTLTTSIKAFNEAAGGVYGALNDVITKGASKGQRPDGFLLDGRLEPVLNMAMDAQKRPIFLTNQWGDSNPGESMGNLLSRRTIIADELLPASSETRGFAGPFKHIQFGTSGDVRFEISNEATVDISANMDGSQMVSTYQQDLVAVKAVTSFVASVPNADNFVKITT